MIQVKLLGIFISVLLVFSIVPNIYPQEDLESLLSTGKKLIKEENYEQAIFYFDKALEIEPNNVKALISKGAAFLALKKFSEAIFYFDKALEIEPNNVQALNNKGNALLKLKKFSEAIFYFDKALEIEPNNLITLHSLGLVYLEMEDMKRALAYFQKVNDINPKFAPSVLTLNALGVNPFVPLDGYLEIIVYDADGRFISYQKIPELNTIDYDSAISVMEKWLIQKHVERNGQTFKLYQSSFEISVEKKSAYGVSGIPLTEEPLVWILYTAHPQFWADLSDSVTFRWSVFVPQT